MSVYYRDDLVTLYHGDCLEQTAWLAADLLVTDPPYGTHHTAANPLGGYGRRGRAGRESLAGATISNDSDTGFRDNVLALWGARPVACFGSPRQPEPPGVWDQRLIWDKVEPGMNGGPFRYTHENIFLRGDGWVRASASSYSILRYPRSDGMGNAERSEHPHRKPVALLARIVEAFPEGVVADPFAGSGSTLIAARNLGRSSVGIEVEERYCEIAAKRLSQQEFNLGGVA